MKIAHLVLNYYPSVGGTQILYKGISEKCVSVYKDEVEVLTVNSYYGSHSNQFKAIKKKQEVINGVLVKRFPFYTFHKPLFKLLAQLIFKLTKKYSTYILSYITGPWSPSLQYAISTTNADVISASPQGFLYMQYPLYRHKFKNPKPFVFQGAIHFAVDESVNVLSNKTLAAIKASEYYMANTTYEKNRLVALGVNPEMIVVAGTAVDVQQFANGDKTVFRNKLHLKDTDILIGYIGRLEKTKSIDILIDAFIKAHQENNCLKLVIAGFETDYIKEIQQKVSNNTSNIHQHIFFKTNITEEDKVNLYHALDFFVLPSINESFGIVFLEAWSCKKPVIGVNIGAVASVIANNKDGLLVNPLDCDDLKNKMLQLASDENLRNTLGENGFQKTKEHYTWEAITKIYRDTYIAAIKKFNSKN